MRAAAAAGGAGAPNNASGGSSEVDMVEPSGGSPSLFGFTFADVVLSINLAYWVALLTSVLTGGPPTLPMPVLCSLLTA